MKTITKPARPSRRGMALLYTVFAVFAAATMVSMMMTLTFSASRSSKTVKYGNQARYMAEGAIEAAKKNVATAIANWSAPAANGTVTLSGVQVPYTVVPTGFSQVVTDPAGIQQTVTGFQIEATATSNGYSHTARRLVNAEATPIFQFAVFYNNDLEVNPGVDMTLGGRVHTNQNMYLNSGGTLTVNTNYLRAVGNIYRTRKDNPALSEGTVKIRQWVQNPFNVAEPTTYKNLNSISQMATLGVPGGLAYDSKFTTGWDANGNGDYTEVDDFLPWGAGALDYWSEPDGYATAAGNTVQDQTHGITEAVVPHIGSVQMYEESPGGAYYYDSLLGEYMPALLGGGTHDKGYYHSEAGLSIVGMANGTIKAYKSDGTPVVLPLTVAKMTTMFDARQGGNVKVTEIDLQQLKLLGYFPANGLLYASHYGAGTGVNAKGVRLKNGAELHNKLTVASENSVYIKGDFNTINKKGAAVIGDAVNLLSNVWNDTKNATSLPAASNTTFNVAIITGNQETASGSYNGGLENLPRFHENWTGKTATIKGSFVNTWNSHNATGGWVYGGFRYTAPTRVWNYDTAFNTVANLPPFTPMAVTARDVVSW
jgi:hypothetical protein